MRYAFAPFEYRMTPPRQSPISPPLLAAQPDTRCGIGPPASSLPPIVTGARLRDREVPTLAWTPGAVRFLLDGNPRRVVPKPR